MRILSPVTQNPIEEKRDTLSPFNVQKIALYALAGMCGGSGFSIVGLRTLAVIPIYSALWSIPLFTSALGLSYAGIQIKDYADPEELKKMQEKAKTQPYDELLSNHSIEIILTYHVVSRAVLQEKFQQSVANLPYLQRIATCPLEQVKWYDLLSHEELRE